MRILVVEDDQEVANLIVRTLEGLGATTKHVSSALQAEAALRESHWDAAIVDIGLADGPRAGLDFIRRALERAQLLIAALTATNDREVERALHRLKVDVLKKWPEIEVDLASFLDRVAQSPSYLASVTARILELTARESEICRLDYAGVSRAEIASTLGISEKTVKDHIRNILGRPAAKGARTLDELRDSIASQFARRFRLGH